MIEGSNLVFQMLARKSVQHVRMVDHWDRGGGGGDSLVPGQSSSLRFFVMFSSPSKRLLRLYLKLAMITSSHVPSNSLFADHPIIRRYKV
jgi:hypothetical protein